MFFFEEDVNRMSSSGAELKNACGIYLYIFKYENRLLL